MKNPNTLILNHFYGLLLEMNFYRDEDDIVFKDELINDPFIQKHLQQIKLTSSRYKVSYAKTIYSQLIKEINRLRLYDFEDLKKMLNPKEALQLQPLFRKFDELSKEDEASIAEDQELLQLITVLKEKMDKLADE